MLPSLLLLALGRPALLRGGAGISGGGSGGSPRWFPGYAESFTVQTVEVHPYIKQEEEDSSGSGGTGRHVVPTVSVRQLIAQDNVSRRSMMLARGQLVRGVLQQIKRCDVHPTGWFASIAGPSMARLQCQNQSISSSPSDCQWTPFWGIPPNASGPTPDRCASTRVVVGWPSGADTSPDRVALSVG
jgi:hypothetical protein